MTDRELLLEEADRFVEALQQVAADQVRAALGPSPAEKLRIWEAVDAVKRAAASGAGTGPADVSGETPETES